MYKIKDILNKLNEESTNDEVDKIQDLICFVCHKKISDGQVYIRHEELKVYCSKECYLKILNSEYY